MPAAFSRIRRLSVTSWRWPPPVDRPRSLAGVGRALARLDRPAVAAAWFTAATLLMTWPLAAHLGNGIPMDLVDPLLNCWILAWGADHVLRFLSGDLGALAGYWHANIFHPEPLALAYSEHLSAQVLQVLPLYAVTRNVVLCYNALFLASFVLSAIGAYLLVRELTRSSTAAFAAGLFYGFALFRAEQLGHLQVLSSQWMPFVLYFLRRFFDTGRARSLAWASLALVAQNLSCGYYFLYFVPFVAAYVLYEMLERGRGRDLGTWLRLALAAGAVAGQRDRDPPQPENELAREQHHGGEGEGKAPRDGQRATRPPGDSAGRRPARRTPAAGRKRRSHAHHRQRDGHDPRKERTLGLGPHLQPAPEPQARVRGQVAEDIRGEPVHLRRRARRQPGLPQRGVGQQERHRHRGAVPLARTGGDVLWRLPD